MSRRVRPGARRDADDVARTVAGVGWLLIIVAVCGSLTVACRVVTGHWLAHAPLAWEMSVVAGMAGTALAWPRTPARARSLALSGVVLAAFTAPVSLLVVLARYMEAR